eukprot:953981-Amphidinium_carterae.1
MPPMCLRPATRKDAVALLRKKPTGGTEEIDCHWTGTCCLSARTLRRMSCASEERHSGRTQSTTGQATESATSRGLPLASILLA